MFDIFPKFLASIASFLFPLFASYKALKTSDPAQLTPWLMYWSVLSCALLVESWLEFVLVWVPFYAWIRFFFLLYLVLPQTQGARYLYEEYLYPYLSENETNIEDFIASAHDKAKAAGIKYFRQAIELLKTKVLGMPPSEHHEDVRAKEQPQTYMQALLARFSVPAARWASGGVENARQDFFSMLSGAVSAVTGASAVSSAGSGAYASSSASRMPGGMDAMTASGTLVPEHIGGAQEKMSFIAQQKEKLAVVLNALDKEAQELEKTEEQRRAAEQGRRERGPTSLSLDGQQGEDTSRPPSGQSMWSALSKSKSEVDFEKIEAESGSEGEEALRRRASARSTDTGATRQGWSFLGWGATGTGSATPTETGQGRSSGYEK